MTRLVRGSLVLLLVLGCSWAWPSLSSAQTPNTGMTAAGVDAGVMIPHGALESTPTLDGFGEYYLTPRVSIRGLLGYAAPGFQDHNQDYFRQVRLAFNAVYNWEGGVWHPYATAGAGAYFVRQILFGRSSPDGEVRGGINLGGGVEYFLNRMNTIKGEARWDIVSHPPDLPDATGFTLTIGVKHYF